MILKLNLKFPLQRDIMDLTLPVIAEQAFMASMGVVNAILSAHIGQEAAAAIGMIDSLNQVFIAFFSALAVGSTVVVAHYKGQGNYKNVKEASRQSFYFSFFFSTFVSLLIWWARSPILTLLYGTAEPQVLQDACQYFEITLYSYPLIAVTSVICGVLRGAGDTKTPAKVIILMNILNLIFSYGLIYGINFRFSSGLLLGFKGFGVTGAAWGIALARAFGAFLLTYFLTKGLNIASPRRFLTYKINPEILKSILNIGIPNSVESTLFSGGKLITQTFIVGLGTVATAANYIGFSLHSMMTVPGNALGIAATTVVGQNMGRCDSEAAHRSLIYMMKLGTGILVILNLLICFPFARYLASMYTASPEIINITAFVLRFTNILIPLWTFAFILPAGLKGAGDAKFTLVVSMLSMWLVRIGLGYLLGVTFRMGLVGIWMAMTCDWAIRGVCFYLRLKRGKWRKNVVVKA